MLPVLLELCIFLIAPAGFVYGILLFILVHLGIDNFILRGLQIVVFNGKNCPALSAGTQYGR